MSYIKNLWKAGDYFTVEKAKNIENEISILDTNKEYLENKIISINSSANNTQYPTAKAVWDLFKNINVEEIKGAIYVSSNNLIFESSDNIPSALKLVNLNVNEDGTYIPESGTVYELINVNFSSTSQYNLKNFMNKDLIEITDRDVSIVGDYAFICFYSLVSVIFPECISIGNSAFYSCYELTNISFPKCTIIGSYAFYQNYSLTSAIFPECIEIGNSAFNSCSNLKTLSFPKCEEIGVRCFRYCRNLQSIFFPECITIKSMAFDNCDNLISISLPKCITIEASAFNDCSKITSISLPECITIQAHAFENCYGLNKVYLSKCETIESRAFKGCTLSFLYIDSPSVCSLLNSDALSNTTIKTGGTIYVPASLVNDYKNAKNWSYFSSRIGTVV